MPKISIIVPVYNTEKYLKLCVDQLLIQKVDCEIILVDDGSRDSCAAICDSYARQNDCVRVIHKVNGGLSMARNTGLEAAAGEYVWFVDSDDWVDAQMAQNMLAAAEKYSADVVVTGISCDYEDTKACVVNQVQKEGVFSGRKACIHAGCLLDGNELLAFATNKLYRHSFLQKNKLCFEKMNGPMEDILFNLQVLDHVDTMVMLSGAPYHYMQHGENSLARRHYSSMFELTQRVNDLRRTIYRDCGMTTEEEKNALAWACFRQEFHCVKNLYNGKGREMRQERRRVWNNILKNSRIREEIHRSKGRYFTAKVMSVAVSLRYAPLASAFVHGVMTIRKRMNPIYKSFRDRVVIRNGK